jgi:RNA polymerase sigma-70 factor (ECF subfamily)
MAATDTLVSPRDAELDDRRLLAGARNGEEDAFAELVRLHGPMMLRLAQLAVGNRSVAEEVVQETWLCVLSGIDRFEGRSSLKTWILRILMNRARTRFAREARTVPFSALGDSGLDSDEPAVDADRFLSPGSPWEGHWASSPRPFANVCEERLLGRETLDVISRALRRLPRTQQVVLTLRDVNGWSAQEVCDALGLTASNQRVLLHRARAKLRAALELHLDPA